MQLASNRVILNEIKMNRSPFKNELINCQDCAQGKLPIGFDESESKNLRELEIEKKTAHKLCSCLFNLPQTCHPC